MSNSTVSGQTVDHAQCPSSVSMAFMVVLSFITLISLVGNVLVIATFVKTPNLRTSTNYFIVNMATSDFICACFTWPVFAAEGMLNGKGLISDPFAIPVCKLGMYFRSISQAVSVISLMLVAVERFIAIVFPLSAWIFSRRVRFICLLLSWFIPIACGSPYVVFSTIVIVGRQTFCRFLWKGSGIVIFYLSGFITFYFLPLLLIVVLYLLIMKSLRKNSARLLKVHASDHRQKQNKNVMRIFISIVSAFFTCWTPLCAYLTLKMFYPSLFLQDKCLLFVGLFFYIFPSLSVAINPVILFAFSSNYRKALINQCNQTFFYVRSSPFCKVGTWTSKQEKVERTELTKITKIQVKYI